MRRSVVLFLAAVFLLAGAALAVHWLSGEVPALPVSRTGVEVEL